MRTVLFGLVFVSPPFLKKLLLKWLCQARIGRGAHIGWFSSVTGRQIELGDHSIIRPFSLIHLDGGVRLGNYSEISSFTLIYGSSSLVTGDYSYIGPQCLVNVDEEVHLGHESALGPRCMLFTHGSFLPYTEGYWVKLTGVTIGDKVWCAAGVFIHPGVEIGDDTFVNSRSVVTQSIPAGSVVEGNPAQVVYPIEQLKRKMSPRRVDAAIDQLLGEFAEIGLRRELGLETIEESKHRLRFHWRGQAYHIALVPSTGQMPDDLQTDNSTRQIFMVNCPDWSPPHRALVFDMKTMQTPFASDRIHTAFRLFMQRYYGVKFRNSEQAIKKG
jgi:acetyltransferase-like isoleucine patch superfamily enzyme